MCTDLNAKIIVLNFHHRHFDTLTGRAYASRKMINKTYYANLLRFTRDEIHFPQHYPNTTEFL